jgi:hypothetical protein
VCGIATGTAAAISVLGLAATSFFSGGLGFGSSFGGSSVGCTVTVAGANGLIPFARNTNHPTHPISTTQTTKITAPSLI